MKSKKNKSTLLIKLIYCCILAILFGCNNKVGKAFVSTAKDTIQLIQTMLDNPVLKDSLFSIQISQNLIIHKDQRIPLGARFSYNSKPATVQEMKFGIKDIDIDHPRFLIAFGKCEIKDSSAHLSFIMPDVGMGISTFWTRTKLTDPWTLARWEEEYY